MRPTTAAWGTAGPWSTSSPTIEAWADQAFAAGPPAMLAAWRVWPRAAGPARVSRRWVASGVGDVTAPGSPEARRRAWLQVVLPQSVGCAAGTCLGCAVAGAGGGRCGCAARAPCSRPPSCRWPPAPRAAARNEMKPNAGSYPGPARAAPHADRAPDQVRHRACAPGRRVRALRRRGAACAGRRDGIAVPSRIRLGGSAARRDDAPVELAVDLGRGLTLGNPLIAAAGAFGTGRGCRPGRPRPARRRSSRAGPRQARQRSPGPPHDRGPGRSAQRNRASRTPGSSSSSTGTHPPGPAGRSR